jgi:prepilin peptidase CpaA
MHQAYIPDTQDLHLLLKILYAGALCYGCVSDIKSLKIPNAVFLAVLALFLLNYWFFAPSHDLTGHFLSAGLALLLGFVIYALGAMGAGDIKLIAALMLWAGTRDGLAFLFVMAMVGGLCAGVLLITRKLIAVWPSTYKYIPSRRLKNWATRGIFPYGIAICTAGLLLMPAFFAKAP